MRRFAALAVLAGLNICLFAGIVLAQRAGSVKKKPPPTSFDQRTEDAFFPDVLKAHGAGTLASLGSGRPVAGSNNNTSTGTPGSAEVGWARTVTADTLEAEIKSIINEVGPHLESKTKWNTGHGKVRRLYTTLAVAFGVISKYDGDVRFKKEALTLRDSLSRAAGNAKVNSEQALQESKARLNDLLQLRNGGSVSLSDSADVKSPWKQVADISEMMKRMAVAHENESEKGNLKAWTASAAEFKTKRSEIIHEAEILGMMTRVLQDPSYEYPEEFVQIAKGVESTTQEIVQAAKSGDHSSAQAAVGKITNACTNCHGKFKD